MINVLPGQETVQGRVDGTRARIKIERGMKIHGHHVVLGLRLRAPVGAVRIKLLKPEQLPLVERGEIFALRIRRSPPDTLTQSTSMFSPVSGSLSRIFEEVLPPPVLVIR